jgi:transcriptional regulator with XRE-family HTH domain
MHPKNQSKGMRLHDIFAANMVRLREEHKWSQEELASEAEIGRTYVSSLERHRYGASLDMVEKIAKAFGVESTAMLLLPPKRR